MNYAPKLKVGDLIVKDIGSSRVLCIERVIHVTPTNRYRTEGGRGLETPDRFTRVVKGISDARAQWVQFQQECIAYLERPERDPALEDGKHGYRAEADGHRAAIQRGIEVRAGVAYGGTSLKGVPE